MGVGWAICPVCGRRFEGSYFPDTGVNTALHTVQRHAILRHRKKITDSGIVDAKLPDDFIRASELKTYIAGGTGNTRLQGRAHIICVCGRYFDVTLEELYDDGKKIKIEVREYDDISRYKKISERREIVKVGHVDVSKFAKLFSQAWENVKENVIREHLEEHEVV